jgi:hypothetical protein
MIVLLMDVNGHRFSSHTQLGTTLVSIEMDDEEVATFAYATFKVIGKNKQGQINWWVYYPINSERLLYGDFYTFYSGLII